MRTAERGQSPLDMYRLLRGAVAGLLASAPMTVAMGLMHWLLPARQRYPLPPRQITMELADRADQEERIDTEAESKAVTGVAHFGYGALGGVLYMLTAERLPLPRLARGLVFGLVFWALGYLGWLPALDILPPATEQPRERTLLMIVAHLIYGSSIALTVEDA